MLGRSMVILKSFAREWVAGARFDNIKSIHYYSFSVTEIISLLIIKAYLFAKISSVLNFNSNIFLFS